MTTSLDYRINDADNHFVEPPDCFERYIDPKFADLAIRNVTTPDGKLVKLFAGKPSKFDASQVTFSKLANQTGGITKDTFIDYCQLLERMDVILTLSAFDQNTLHGFPKKAKKIHFADPFIAAVVERWLVRERYVTTSLLESQKVESIVASHFQRRFPTFYIKADGEVDVVYVQDARFYPVEVKWANQVRARDLKQIVKYPEAKLLNKQHNASTVSKIPTSPLPLALIELP